jgi:hypothetical protein
MTRDLIGVLLGQSRQALERALSVFFFPNEERARLMSRLLDYASSTKARID